MDNIDVNDLTIVDILTIAPEIDVSRLRPVTIDGVEYPLAEEGKVWYPIAEIATPNLELPLPHWVNPLAVDVRNIYTSIEMIDANAKDLADTIAAGPGAEDLERLNAHIAATTGANGTGVHGAVSMNTPNKLIIRDANGRARVSGPVYANDIANKQYVETAVNGAKITLSDAIDGTGTAAEKKGASEKAVSTVNAAVANLNATLSNHTAATTSVHGAVSAATGNRIVIRDANGRAQFANPNAAQDAATKGWSEGRFLQDAAEDGVTYGRKDGEWAAVNKAFPIKAWAVVGVNGGVSNAIPTFVAGAGIESVTYDNSSTAYNFTVTISAGIFSDAKYGILINSNSVYATSASIINKSATSITFSQRTSMGSAATLGQVAVPFTIALLG
ncbi:hypothetical protein LJC71_05025 [Desulfosarcina sp. OttesenSCG-928-A07]|nr:hypothetical protein [Desulfosarcina sp. OttesenSCG-928-G17]MDL2329101.1 hypothetical protein [Desulfosarcina sp. OttesenSCG-928-A07]